MQKRRKPKIRAATSTDAINAIKEEGVQALKDAKELQDAKTTAIAALNEAKITYPSDAAEGIVSTYTGKIHAATATDAINAIKEEGVQALIDAYNAQKEAERLAALDAVTVTQTAEDDFSYLLEDGVRFKFDGDNVYTTVNGEDKPGFTLSETVAIKICPARTFKLKANQDPDHPDRYYSTFYTGKGAYKVPETAKAYTGTIEDGEEEGIGILALSAVEGVIPCGEAVVVRGSQKNITLMPSCKKLTPLASNILEGTDAATTLGTDQYALSLGQHGVGFYLWDGKTIGANKAYLTLDEALGVKALQFRFNDEPGTTGIKAPSSSSKGENPATYDLKGMLVNDGYRGIVVRNGKKALKK